MSFRCRVVVEAFGLDMISSTAFGIMAETKVTRGHGIWQQFGHEHGYNGYQKERQELGT